MSLIEAPGGVCFCLRSLRRGLSASLPRGQTQVMTIKAELLTPIPKNETAHCVATDSRHNEPLVWVLFSPDAMLLFLAAAEAACRDSPLWLASDPIITRGCPPFIGFLSDFYIDANEGWRQVHPRTLRVL